MTYRVEKVFWFCFFFFFFFWWGLAYSFCLMWEGFLELFTGKSRLPRQRFHVDSDLAFFFKKKKKVQLFKAFRTIKAEVLFGDFLNFFPFLLDELFSHKDWDLLNCIGSSASYLRTKKYLWSSQWPFPVQGSSVAFCAHLSFLNLSLNCNLL